MRLPATDICPGCPHQTLSEGCYVDTVSLEIRAITAFLDRSISMLKSLKSECIRPGTPLSLDDARRLVQGYVEHYNNTRLNSAIGYVTPKDMLAGRQHEIHAERDRKLEAAREQRKNLRQRVA